MPLKKSDSPWIELDTVDSTNNYAMGLIHAGLAQHGTVVLARHQSKGKGQRGKIWETAPGANLSFSIILQPTFLVPSQMFQLLAVTTLAAFLELEKRIGDEASIKWPNDLYWRDRKTGGILIENVIRGTQWQWAVAGIGINVNQTTFGQLQNPVSIKQITGKETVVEELAHAIHRNLMDHFTALEEKGFQHFFELYNQYLYKSGQQVQLKKGSRSFTTKVNGVNKQGQLITGIETEECFDFGEVEWVF
jgi:BirA family biotin operon repressor/biotin-[acetyl-CoA-carboxylase] ligase